ncbi:MAG: hypothetical protein ABR588_09765 [Sphingomicrobium sp.]|nr:hypothetical protein [Sphingomonadales bacterium]
MLDRARRVVDLGGGVGAVEHEPCRDGRVVFDQAIERVVVEIGAVAGGLEHVLGGVGERQAELGIGALVAVAVGHDILTAKADQPVARVISIARAARRMPGPGEAVVAA